MANHAHEITRLGNNSYKEAVFYKKAVFKKLKNFAEFTGKLLCPILIFNKIAGLRLGSARRTEAPIELFFCEFCESF